MKAEDHKLLASWLIQNAGDPVLEEYAREFRWGSVAPDYNYLTYLHGSLRCKNINGHHAVNRISFIIRQTEKLENSVLYNRLSFFRIGILIHYLADCFTLAHNEGFPKKFKEHMEYEEELHTEICKALSDGSAPTGGFTVNQASDIFRIHLKYCRAEQGTQNDIKNITSICLSVVRLLCRAAAANELQLSGEALPQLQNLGGK